MKIDFISQIDPFLYSGGGEMINSALLEQGREQGHEIMITAVYPERSRNGHSEPDLTILSDVYNQPSNSERLEKALLEDIIANRPYIHLDNAYVDICDMPSLPCNGESNGSRCPFKISPRAQAHRLHRRLGCFAAKTRRIYENSHLNVFLSPLHKQVIEGVLGGLSGESFVLRPTVDTGVFYNRGLERDIENLFVGTINEAKGMENLKRAYPRGDVIFVGPPGAGADKAFGTWLGKVDYTEIPAIMNRARNFIYLPRWPEPMGRVVVEAALCGCNLVTNDNIGATSFDFDISDAANLAGATREFWNIVDSKSSPLVNREAGRHA